MDAELGGGRLAAAFMAAQRIRNVVPLDRSKGVPRPVGMRLTYPVRVQVGREVAALDLVAGAQYKGVFDDMFELSNVFRKVVGTLP